MADNIEKFFNAYCTGRMKSVYTDKVPKEMMNSPVDNSGYYEWKLISGTLTNENYREIENGFQVTFPVSFIEWHKRYFFADGDCSLVRLPASFPAKPLEEIVDNLNWHIAEELIPLGFVPFANEGNDTGPLVFDTRNTKDQNDYPIRVYDHEFGGDIDGLSDVIFSSFDKLLECLTHFLIETKTKQGFQVIPDFYRIDPLGAGSTGRSYWSSWVEMGKANYESFNL